MTVVIVPDWFLWCVIAAMGISALAKLSTLFVIWLETRRRKLARKAFLAEYGDDEMTYTLVVIMALYSSQSECQAEMDRLTKLYPDEIIICRTDDTVLRPRARGE